MILPDKTIPHCAAQLKGLAFETPLETFHALPTSSEANQSPAKWEGSGKPRNLSFSTTFMERSSISHHWKAGQKIDSKVPNRERICLFRGCRGMLLFRYQRKICSFATDGFISASIFLRSGPVMEIPYCFANLSLLSICKIIIRQGPWQTTKIFQCELCLSTMSTCLA